MLVLNQGQPALVIISFLICLVSFTQAYPKFYPISRSCGTPDPSQNLSSTHRWLQVNEPRDNALYNSTLLSARLSHPFSRRAPLITVPTYFHIITDFATAQTDSPAYIAPNQLAAQHIYLQTAYAPYGISFNLLETTRTINPSWASGLDDFAMKLAVRRGTYQALNIYFQSDLRDTSNGGVGPGSLLLGFCTLPSAGITPLTPSGEYADDGCNILSSTLPGGSYSGYNLGGTTVHEVGHFLGLLHTFHGETCSSTDFGDFVADTPQQSVATEGCPVGNSDSCPSSGVPVGWAGANGQGENPYGPSGFSGMDSKENFMDYSSDVCYRGFSGGQGARMVNLWGLYREGR